MVLGNGGQGFVSVGVDVFSQGDKRVSFRPI